MKGRSLRKNLSLLLFGLGGFLLVAGLIVALWVPGMVERTPLNTDQEVRLAGTAAYQNQPRTRVEAVQRNRVIGSKSNGSRVVFQVFECLYKDPNNTISSCPGPTAPQTITQDGDKPNDRASVLASTFAADRHTGMALSHNLPSDVGPRTGLVNKFPFGMSKHSYKLWDDVVHNSNEAVYQGEEKLQGVTVYRFNVKVSQKNVEFSTPLGNVAGDYTSDRTLWVDPVTGAIQNYTEKQVRTDTKGNNLINLDYAFTDKQVANNISQAKSNDREIKAVKIAPWVLLPLAVIMLIVAFLLRNSVRARSTGPRGTDETDGDNYDGDNYDDDDTQGGVAGLLDHDDSTSPDVTRPRHSES